MRGSLDLLAASAAAVALATLARADMGAMEPALLVYVSGLVVMFSVSSAYHSIPWTSQWKDRLRRADHAAIFLVIAGSLTPIAVAALDEPWRTGTLVWMWTATLIGVIVKLREAEIRLGRSMVLQNLIGWSAVIPLVLGGRGIGAETLELLFLGGAIHTVGAILFALRRPILAPGFFSFHEVFHVFVVTGTAIHFHVIVTRIVPLAS